MVVITRNGFSSPKGCWKVRSQYFLGSRSKLGLYDKEPLSCSGHSDENISESVKIN